MWTTRYTTRAPALVVDEIEDYVRRYRVENIDFYDLTAIVKRDWILEFCRLLDARGLRITWQLPSGTRSEALDEPVLRAMYRSGCRNVSYAPESGSERTLEAIKKKVKLDRLEALDAHRRARRAQREGEHPDRVPRRADSTTCATRCASSCAWRASACTTSRCGRSRRIRARSCSSDCAPPGVCRSSTTTTTPRCSRTPTSRGAVSYADGARLDAAAALPARRAAALLRRELSHPSGAPAALALQHRHAALRVAHGDVVRQPGAPAVDRARAQVGGGVVRVTFVTCGLEHLGIEALSAWVRQAGHEPTLVYEARPFSSGSGTDSRAAGAPARSATRGDRRARRRHAARCRRVHVVQRHPSLVGRGRARGEAARATCRSSSAGRTCRPAPERAIREWSIDAVVEGEGEGALVDLIECAERGRFGRTDVANCTFKGDGGADPQPRAPAARGSRRAAVGRQARLLRRGAGVRARVLRRLAARLSVPLQLLRVQHLPAAVPGREAGAAPLGRAPHRRAGATGRRAAGCARSSSGTRSSRSTRSGWPSSRRPTGARSAFRSSATRTRRR